MPPLPHTPSPILLCALTPAQQHVPTSVNSRSQLAPPCPPRTNKRIEEAEEVNESEAEREEARNNAYKDEYYGDDTGANPQSENDDDEDADWATEDAAAHLEFKLKNARLDVPEDAQGTSTGGAGN